MRNTFLDIEAWQILPFTWLSFCFPITPNQKDTVTHLHLQFGKSKDFCLPSFPDSSERGWHGYSMLAILPSVVSCSINCDADQFKEIAGCIQSSWLQEICAMKPPFFCWIGHLYYFVCCSLTSLIKVQECCQDGPHGWPLFGFDFPIGSWHRKYSPRKTMKSCNVRLIDMPGTHAGRKPPWFFPCHLSARADEKTMWDNHSCNRQYIGSAGLVGWTDEEIQKIHELMDWEGRLGRY